MSTFNPDKAVMVDESADMDELDGFLSRLDSKAKSFRTSLIADAFKELANVAKAERGKLLEVAAKEFATAMDGALEKAVEKFDKAVRETCEQMKAGHEKMGAQGDAISTKLGRLEKLVRDMDARPTPEVDHQPILTEIRNATNELRAELAAMDSRHPREAEDSGDVEKIIAAIKSSVPAKPREFTLRHVRDDWGKITHTVVIPAQ